MNTFSIPFQTVCFLIQVANIAVQVHLYHKNTTCYLRWHSRIFLRLRWFNIGAIVWACFWMTWAVYWIAKDMGVIA